MELLDTLVSPGSQYCKLVEVEFTDTGMTEFDSSVVIERERRAIGNPHDRVEEKMNDLLTDLKIIELRAQLLEAGWAL